LPNLLHPTDPSVRKIAMHRIRRLQSLYPELLPPSAIQGSLSLLPMDIRQVVGQQLIDVVQQFPQQQWLVVGGWPCQDLSLAGCARGMSGNRAQLLHDVVRVIGTLQQLSQQLPPAYLLENVAFQHHKDPAIAQGDFALVTSIIGQPVLLDAAQVGSLAHRARNYWTNLCLPVQLSAALSCMQRPANRTVSMVLPAHRKEQPVIRPDPEQQFPCNQPGQQRLAWPTLMGRPGSYAFRPGQAGSVLDHAVPKQPQWTEPTAEEREFPLGYMPCSTATHGVTELERRKALGQCMDANALQVIMATSKAWWFRSAKTSHAALAHAAQTGVCNTIAAAKEQPFSVTLTCALVAELCDNATSPASGTSDIWKDEATLKVLQSGVFPAGLEARERARVARRVKQYSWEQGVLRRRMPDGALPVVPAPESRASIIIKQHELCGHFGIRRTAALVLTKYWWHGLLADAAHLINRCEQCKRVQASFTNKPQALQSIPISSIGFRWHVDTAGPLTESARGNRYFMVAVEAFTKYVEVVPIPDNKSETMAYAFLHNVLARYASPGQVVTDNGVEYDGSFDQLLQDCMIDHRHSSPAHPQANGQAEKAVHIVKTALTKMCQSRRSLSNWDEDVAWLMLGYRCSPQSSTGFTPYELMFARPPVVPPATLQLLSQPLDYDDPELAAQDLLQRKELVQRITPLAMNNLSIAQHKDQRRYKQTREPDYEPQRHTFKPGEFVYLQQLQRHNTLQPKAKPAILRITEVRPSGVLQLQGRCGRTVEVSMQHCSPCPLPGIDGSIDPLLGAADPDALCEVCGSLNESQSPLLLCDICDAAYHLHCLQPTLAGVPAGHWICPKCCNQGYTLQDAALREQQREELTEREAAPNMFPTAATKRRDVAASQLNGRYVKQPFHDPAVGKKRDYWGRLHYRGSEHRPYYFQVVWEDKTTNAASMKGVKKWLQQKGTALPAGVNIPSLAEVSTTAATASSDMLAGATAGNTAAVYLDPNAIKSAGSSVRVTAADIVAAMKCLEFSLAQEICNPCATSTDWQRAFQAEGTLTSNGEPTSPASVIFMAAAGVQLQQLWSWLEQAPAALLVCFLPSKQLPAQIAGAVQQLRATQRSVFLPADTGVWLVACFGALPLRHWLKGW
jgi:transposase InsO family protein